jgi:hypothetical protein
MGTERVVAWLADELVALGHEVTLFASGDSRTKAKLVPAWPQALRSGRPRSDPAPAYAELLEAVAEAANDFDGLRDARIRVAARITSKTGIRQVSHSCSTASPGSLAAGRAISDGFDYVIAQQPDRDCLQCQGPDIVGPMSGSGHSRRSHFGRGEVHGVRCRLEPNKPGDDFRTGFCRSKRRAVTYDFLL